ncbi:SPK domain-containing protein [Caenorhabditis elegans]|uniref:SPK domain-containing protein n=1 Tax=Caenorhabditis elegans TaxID=6239 RepID=Q8I7G1_CAEEL|nr:SPK domain-containing protein [Caenorhabditis elegans]CCD63896.1 SPK domain-containing protein [Caenorhabditis elegans]|eukprot:NP_001249919.1 Uncharacterized protein CELE_F59A3.2 [Caenorhabditis elegans]
MKSIGRLNKRKVFADSDPEKEEEAKSPPKKKSKRSSRCFNQNRTPDQKTRDSAGFSKNVFVASFQSFFKRSKIWPLLTIRGPYIHIVTRLSNSSIKNRPFYCLIREILEKVHERTLEYRDVDIPKITQRSDVSNKPRVENVMAITEKMCQKVFRLKNENGLSIDLYEDGMIAPLRNVFFKKVTRIPYDSSTEIRDRLSTLCQKRNIYVTREELEDGRNAFVQYCYNLSLDLFLHILSTNVNKFTGSVQIQAFRTSEVHSNLQIHTDTTWFGGSARLKSITSSTLERGRPPASLWLTIPCEEKEHLLEHVFEHGLIQLMPDGAKTFFDAWMIGVRKRMRKRLTSGDLRQVVETVMSESSYNREMTLNDDRIEQFVVKMIDNVLNTKKLKIFDGKWKDFTIDLIKNMKGNPFGEFPDCQKIIGDVCEKMKPSYLSQLTTLFSSSPSDQSMLAHTLLQLLRFVVCLSLNTIRHAFHFHRETFTVSFDGQLDDEVTDFDDFDQTIFCESSSANSSCYPTPPIERHILRPRVTLLPTPTLVFVPISPVKNLPSDFNPRIPPPQIYSSPGQALFNPTNLYPTPPSSLPNTYVPNQESFDESVNRDKKSFIFNNHSKANFSNPTLTAEVTEEELLSARALRTPSVVSGSMLNQLDDEDGDLPKKWVNAYKLTLEWNQDLKSELEKVKNRLDKLS